MNENKLIDYVFKTYIQEMDCHPETGEKCGNFLWSNAKDMVEDILSRINIKELQHHKNTTVGLYATDRPIENLLHDFWNRSSDACPIDATEMEEQEKKFSEWAKSISFRISPQPC